MKHFIKTLIFILYTHLSFAEPYTPQETHYVKIDIVTPDGTALCGGSLIAPNLILTASHCILDNWSSLQIYYGKNFSSYVTVDRDNIEPNWIEFDHNGVIVDLGMVKLPYSIAGKNNAKVVPVTTQGECGIRSYANLDFRMGKDYSPLAANLMDTVSIYIDTIEESILARGLYLTSDNADSRSGDSGGPLLSKEGVQIGLLNGTSKQVFQVGNQYIPVETTYYAALCKYADNIKTFGNILNNQ